MSNEVVLAKPQVEQLLDSIDWPKEMIRLRHIVDSDEVDVSSRRAGTFLLALHRIGGERAVKDWLNDLRDVMDVKRRGKPEGGLRNQDLFYAAVRVVTGRGYNGRSSGKENKVFQAFLEAYAPPQVKHKAVAEPEDFARVEKEADDKERVGRRIVLAGGVLGAIGLLAPRAIQRRLQEKSGEDALPGDWHKQSKTASQLGLVAGVWLAADGMARSHEAQKAKQDLEKQKSAPYEKGRELVQDEMVATAQEKNDLTRDSKRLLRALGGVLDMMETVSVRQPAVRR